MLAYHNDPSFKERFLVEIRWHRTTDSIRQGCYWSGMERGCAIGCSINSLVRMGEIGETLNHADHDRLSSIINVPVALLHLEDTLFESLTREQAQEWPERFADAITAGADLSMVFPTWMLWLVTNEEWDFKRFLDTDEQRHQADIIISWIKLSADGATVSNNDWRQLANAIINTSVEEPSHRGHYAILAMQYVATSMRSDSRDCLNIVVSNVKHAFGRSHWEAFATTVSNKLIELLQEAA